MKERIVPLIDKVNFDSALNDDFYRNIPIFDQMTDLERNAAFTYLNARPEKYKKGAIILHSGKPTKNMGIVLEGSVIIENSDAWGNRAILSIVSARGFFAESYGMMPNEPLLIDVRANEDCMILFLRISDLINHFMDKEESWVNKLTKNLLTISTQKNLTLSRRSLHTSAKSTRGRIMSYLTSISLKKQKNSFEIPFDRQQMADYLNVERSALSKELGKMQAEGIIRFNKNRFEILE